MRIWFDIIGHICVFICLHSRHNVCVMAYFDNIDPIWALIVFIMLEIPKLGVDMI